MWWNARLAKLERMSFDNPVPSDDRDGASPPAARGWWRRSARLGAIAAVLVLVLGCIVALRPDDPQRAEADRAPSTVKPSTVAPLPSTTSTLAGVATTAVPAGVPGAPGRLVIATPALDFGPTGVLRQLRLRNPGEQPVLWSAAGAVGWVSVAPASGGIAGGDETLVAVSLDRDRAPEGTIATTIAVTGSEGTARVAVKGTVDHPPRITGEAIDVTEVYAQGDACGPVVATVTATVTEGKGPLAGSVGLGWRRPDQQEHTVVMTSTGPGVWQGGLGPFPASGNIEWWVVATDAGGNRTRGIDRVLPVLDCVP
jgi:hypothetical protein